MLLGNWVDWKWYDDEDEWVGSRLITWVPVIAHQIETITKPRSLEMGKRATVEIYSDNYDSSNKSKWEDDQLISAAVQVEGKICKLCSGICKWGQYRKHGFQ